MGRPVLLLVSRVRTDPSAASISGYRARPISFAAGVPDIIGPECIWTAEKLKKAQSRTRFSYGPQVASRDALLNGHLDADGFELFLHNQGNAFRTLENEASETQGSSRCAQSQSSRARIIGEPRRLWPICQAAAK